jgi:hypothetical protein
VRPLFRKIEHPVTPEPAETFNTARENGSLTIDGVAFFTQAVSEMLS